MKNIIGLIIMFMLLPVKGYSVDASFVKTGGSDKQVIGTLANEAGLAYNRNYYVSPGSYGMGKMSAIIYYAPTTYADVVFSTPNINMGSANISATAHSLTLGLPVLLTITAGTAPGPLVDQTTYYAIPVSANIVQLATTSAQAVSGDPIIFVSSTTGATQTYTLSDIALVGNTTFAYSGSNDGTNFYAITSSAVVAGTPARTWGYDFSEFNYAVLKLAVTSPTAGSIAFSNYLNLKP